MTCDDELLTTSELAADWKRNPETLVRWRRLRKGPPFLYLNGRVLYSRQIANEWLVQQQMANGRNCAGSVGVGRTSGRRANQADVRA